MLTMPTTLLVSLAVCLLCFSRGMEASTTVTIVTTSSTTTTTTKTEPMSPTDTPTQPAPQKCPSITPESVSPAQKTGSVQEKFLHISVDPVTITEGQTGQLTINCTFWAMPGAQVSQVGVIGLYRLRDVKSSFGLEKQEVATAAGRGKNEPIATENLKITRQVNINGLSYLNLTIIAPTSKDEGLYRCTIVGADTHKEPFMAQASMGVGLHGSDKQAPASGFASTPPPKIDSTAEAGVDLGQLKTLTKTMQLAFDDIANKVSSLEKFQANVDSRLVNIKDSLFLDPLTQVKSEYVFSKTDFSSFATAQATCEIFGGFLAEMDDIGEFKLLLESIGDIFEGDGADSSITEVEGILIGGTFEEGKWLNKFDVNNSSYFQWKDGVQPSDTSKKCVVLLKDALWDMTDQACRNENSHFRFMCEIPRRK